MTFDMDETLEAKWAVDNETGIEYLLDLKTGQKLGMKINGIWMNPEEKSQ